MFWVGAVHVRLTDAVATELDELLALEVLELEVLELDPLELDPEDSS